jgi:hypothetical protein
MLSNSSQQSHEITTFLRTQTVTNNSQVSATGFYPQTVESSSHTHTQVLEDALCYHPTDNQVFQMIFSLQVSTLKFCTHVIFSFACSMSWPFHLQCYHPNYIWYYLRPPEGPSLKSDALFRFLGRGKKNRPMVKIRNMVKGKVVPVHK